MLRDDPAQRADPALMSCERLYKKRESGAGILEVLIAFALLAIASVAALHVYAHQAAETIALVQQDEAFSVFAAGDSALRTVGSTVLSLNGSVITASAAPGSISTRVTAPIQSVLSLLPNAQLHWQISSLSGNVCPCQVTQTLQWGMNPSHLDHSSTSQTVVNY